MKRKKNYASNDTIRKGNKTDKMRKKNCNRVFGKRLVSRKYKELLQVTQ